MRVFLTAKERNELRKYAKNNPKLTQNDLQAWTQRTIGKNVGRSTVGKVINTEIETMLNPDREKRRCVKYPAMEEELYKFVLRHENDAFFSDELVWMKAKEFLKQLDTDATV
jgi:hypothetical protein